MYTFILQLQVYFPTFYIFLYLLSLTILDNAIIDAITQAIITIIFESNIPVSGFSNSSICLNDTSIVTSLFGISNVLPISSIKFPSAVFTNILSISYPSSGVISNLILLSSLEFLHKGLIKDNELAAKLVMFNKFLDDNHYSLDSLVNEGRDEWINPFTNKISNSSFIELYDKAVLDCLDAIMTVHNYLSGKIPGDILQAMFNCSYDTGEKMTMPEYKSLRKK